MLVVDWHEFSSWLFFLIQIFCLIKNRIFFKRLLFLCSNNYFRSDFEYEYFPTSIFPRRNIFFLKFIISIAPLFSRDANEYYQINSNLRKVD